MPDNPGNARARHQTVRVLDGAYVLERAADGTAAVARAGVLAVVFGPDGCTVMRRDDTGPDPWSATPIPQPPTYPGRGQSVRYA